MMVTFADPRRLIKKQMVARRKTYRPVSLIHAADGCYICVVRSATHPIRTTTAENRSWNINWCIHNHSPLVCSCGHSCKNLGADRRLELNVLFGFRKRHGLYALFACSDVPETFPTPVRARLS